MRSDRRSADNASPRLLPGDYFGRCSGSSPLGAAARDADAPTRNVPSRPTGARVRVCARHLEIAMVLQVAIRGCTKLPWAQPTRQLAMSSPSEFWPGSTSGGTYPCSCRATIPVKAPGARRPFRRPTTPRETCDRSGLNWSNFEPRGLLLQCRQAALCLPNDWR